MDINLAVDEIKANADCEAILAIKPFFAVLVKPGQSSTIMPTQPTPNSATSAAGATSSSPSANTGAAGTKADWYV